MEYIHEGMGRGAEALGAREHLSHLSVGLGRDNHRHRRRSIMTDRFPTGNWRVVFSVFSSCAYRALVPEGRVLCRLLQRMTLYSRKFWWHLSCWEASRYLAGVDSPLEGGRLCMAC